MASFLLENAWETKGGSLLTSAFRSTFHLKRVAIGPRPIFAASTMAKPQAIKTAGLKHMESLL